MAVGKHRADKDDNQPDGSKSRLRTAGYVEKHENDKAKNKSSNKDKEKS